MNNKVFYKNTIMLYLLRVSNYLFSFVSVPLQTRVLGPNFYALLGFSLSFSNYFQNFIDFGFTLSATEKISKNKDNKDYINKMLSKVIFCRLFLTFISILIFIILILFIDELKNNRLILLLYFLLSVVLCFLPDFLYLGLEKMQYLTYKSIISRGIFTILLFVFLREQKYYYLVPIFNIIGNLLALFLVYQHIIYKLGYRIVKVNILEIIDELKWTSQFFFSRFASSIYSTINTITIGFVFGSSSTKLGLFKSADQSISVGKQVVIPITDSLFPHMVNKKDFKLFKNILVFGSFIIIIGTIIVNIFAEYLCLLLFGEKFVGSALYLRILSPSVLFAFLTMMFGYPALSAIGQIKHANYSNIVSAVFQIIMLIFLLLSNHFTITNLCVLTCVSEFILFIYRLIVFLYFRRYVYER